jgi:hypothetical protein
MLRQRKAKALRSTEDEPESSNKESNEIIETHTKRRKLFEDRLSLWAAEKVQYTALQEDAVHTKVAAKKEIWKLKVEREKALTKLPKEEIRDRIALQRKKHAAELRLLVLQSQKFL